jgi:hypothetical protein
MTWKRWYDWENNGMKTGMHYRLSAALALLLLLQGCDEKNYFITTIVSIEGAIDRMVEWRGVSDSSKWAQLPIPVDSTWHVSFKPATKGDSISVLSVSKHFASFDELTLEYARHKDPAKVHVRVNVDRRFRWFYTYYDYAETYADPHPLGLLSAREFFTPAEYQHIVAGDRMDTLHARIKAWHEKNLSELMFTRLLTAVEQLHDPRLPASTFISSRDRVEYLLMGDSIYKGSDVRLDLKGSEVGRSLADPAIRALQDLFHADAVEKLREPFINATVEYLADQEKLDKIQGTYTNAVVLPGVILETNATDVSGSRVTWRVDGDQISVVEVQMHALSRVVNTWAIVVSALAVVGLILLPVMLRRRHPAV